MLFVSLVSVLCIILAVYLRIKNTKNFDIGYSDLFYTLVFFMFFYLIIAQHGVISWDYTNQDNHFYSNILVMLSCLGVLSITYFTNIKVSNEKYNINVSEVELKIIIISSILCILFGYLSLVYNYGRLGNIQDILSFSQRSERMAILSSLRGNIPYMHFFVIGYTTLLLTGLWSESLKNKHSFIKVYIYSLLWILPFLLFLIYEGDRSGILKFIILSFFIAIQFNKFKPKIIHLLYLFIIYSLFAVIGNVRGELQKTFKTGNISHLVEAYNNKDISTLLSTVEFKSVNFTLHRVVDINNLIDYPGESYIQSIKYILPRSIHPGKKEKNIADKLAHNIRTEKGIGYKIGFGISPVAESYVNFGISGPPLIFMIYVLFINKITLLSLNSNIYYRVYGILFITTIPMIFRNSFASQVSNIFWLTLLASILFVFIKIVNKLYNKKEKFKVGR